MENRMYTFYMKTKTQNGKMGRPAFIVRDGEIWLRQGKAVSPAIHGEREISLDGVRYVSTDGRKFKPQPGTVVKSSKPVYPKYGGYNDGISNYRRDADAFIDWCWENDCIAEAVEAAEKWIPENCRMRERLVGTPEQIEASRLCSLALAETLKPETRAATWKAWCEEQDELTILYAERDRLALQRQIMEGFEV